MYISEATFCQTPVGLNDMTAYTPNLPTNFVDVRGFDSSTILI